MKFDIIEVFTRAAKITWKHKVLWLFGILASCGRGSGGNSNSSSNNTYQPGDNGPSREMIRQLSELMEKVGSWFSENPWIIFVLIAVFLVVWLVQILLTTIGQIGLIRGAYHAEMGVDTIKFGELFKESLAYFWRIIGLGIVVFLPVILGLIVMFVAVIFLLDASTDSTAVFGAISLAVGICCCFLPLMMALGLYYSQAARALILEDMGVFAALSRGWEVFRKNIGGLLVVAVILILVNLIVGIAIAIPLYIAIFPIMFSFLAGNISSWQPFILVGIFILLYSPVAWFLGGLLLTYTETIWTLIYIRVALPKEEAPVMIEANA